MESENNIIRFLILLICLLLSKFTFAKSKLPILATKQDIHNIRFISSDGKYTYYQRSSGDLILSSNYNIRSVLKGQKLTQYKVYGSKWRKKIIISVSGDYHYYYNIRQLNKLYQVEFGKNEAELLGMGTNPTLHLNDSWISYFNPYNRKIHFQNLGHKELQFEISLANKINHYFVPSVVMPDNKTVIYTDLDEKGLPGIMRFSINNKKFDLILKGKTHMAKIELCLDNNKLYVGHFGIGKRNQSSTIQVIDKITNITMKNSRKIYHSDLNDIGNIICSMADNNLYFVKSLKTSSGKINNEIVSIEPVSGKISILTDLKYASQVINIDGRLICPFRGQYYLVIGKNNMENDKIPGSTF